MPCRKESYIFLEQSVTVDSKEVDALVTQINEALQLHNNSSGTGGHHQHQRPPQHLQRPPQHPQRPPLSPHPAAALRLQQLRLRSGRGACRATPYRVPGSEQDRDRDRDWDQIRPWGRGLKKRRLQEEEQEPHRLLQELILSGNLIKEAVRRLQFTAAERSAAAAESVPC